MKNRELFLKRILLILTGLTITSFFLAYIWEVNPLKSKKEYSFLPNPDEYSKEPASAAPTPLASGTPEPIEITVVKGWKLIFSDDFSEKEINTDKWNKLDKKDSPNDELQYYDPVNATAQGGNLFLTAEYKSKNGKEYTSALVDTSGKFSFCYGKLEIRLKLPQGKGFFPAIWLLPEEEGQNYYEIDVMENIGSEPATVYGVSHYSVNGKMYRSYSSTEIENQQDFHVYCVEWTDKELKWYVDGVLFYQTQKGVPQQKMYIIMNLAVGGNWPGDPDENTQFPSSMIIDYIRVCQYVE